MKVSFLTLAQRELDDMVAWYNEQVTWLRDYRTIAMAMMYRYSRISQEEIGKRFGNLDYSAVSGERNRLRERMPLDRSLAGSVQAIDGHPAWRRQKSAFLARLYPQELESTPAM